MRVCNIVYRASAHRIGPRPGDVVQSRNGPTVYLVHAVHQLPHSDRWPLMIRYRLTCERMAQSESLRMDTAAIRAFLKDTNPGGVIWPLVWDKRVRKNKG